MKNARYTLILPLFIALTLPHLVFSQDSQHFEIEYKVNRMYPSLSITKEKLKEAHTLVDINQYYKPTWVKEYISVEISGIHKEKIQKALGKNDIFTKAQKDLINTADAGTDISVQVHYIPNNNLKNNEAKYINFSFTVEPENEASYVGGARQLKQYLKENVADKILEEGFEMYRLAAVTFAIDEQGQIIDAQVFDTPYQTFRDTKTEEVLLEAVCNMPNWKPAQYANGMKVKQQFVLTVGDHRSCVINLFNIHRDEM